MKTISISKSSLAEVNAAVAEYIAGWKRVSTGGLYAPDLPPAFNVYGIDMPVPDYATDANAVLPLLAKFHCSDAQIYRGTDYYVGIDAEPREFSDKRQFEATARTFPLAACFALLRANKVTVID